MFCGKSFEKGKIFQEEDGLYDAFGAVRAHVKMAHGTPTNCLLSGNPAAAGISGVQKRLLELLSEGKNDRQIAAEMGITPSTVRNHRFRLREKEKQAKIFLAPDARAGTKDKGGHYGYRSGKTGRKVHPAAAMVDDRYSITWQRAGGRC